MEALSTRTLQRPLLLLLLLLGLLPHTEAMEVTSSGPQTVQKAQGSTVHLGCTYTAGLQDAGELDIEWFNLRPDMTQKDQLILSYTGGQTHRYGDPAVSSRFRFTGSPTAGDASIAISEARVSDTATYQCKVKKAPGVDTYKLTLLVMAPPSAPKCWVEGPEEKGGAVSLRCESSVGSAPLGYTWKRETGGAIPPGAVQNPETGELLIKNHSDANVGSYMCEAKNAVGRGECRYQLHAYNPTDKVGVIVGAVIGAILLLLLLLLLIWLIICCCHKRRYVKEVANDIREDAPAPESRPTSRHSSRHSSLRSALGYRTHAGVYYSPAEIQQPGGQSQRSNSTSTAGGAKPLQYDHRYGYPV